MAKSQKRDARRLHDEWESALERAVEDSNRESALDNDSLNNAAGLHVQSGVVGGWSGSCSCQDTCAPSMC